MPPNILFIVSDQQRWDTLGVLNSAIQTPNLDRLARSGMLIERTYAPTPVCLPCRASIITGQYPSSHRATWNHSALPQDHWPLISTVMREAGYFTHMIGKSHLSSCHDPMSLESAPHIHNREYFRKWHGPWYGFERADISIGHSTEKHACGMHYGVWLENQGVDTDQYFGRTEYEQYGAWDLPEEYHSSKWMADVASETIRSCSERQRPFFLHINFQDPHNPCMVPEPWATMYNPNSLPKFGFKPGEPECFADKPHFYQEVIDQPGPYKARTSDPALPGAGNVSHLDWTQEQIQANAACYYGMVSLMDHHIGRLLDVLEETGQAENTLVVFTSDHGDLLGDHGFWWKSIVCYEESIRVPMIVSLPNRIPAGSTSRAFHSLIDLFPTFCQFADIKTPIECEGVGQREVWEGRVSTVRDAVTVEERPSYRAWNQRIFITDEYKLVFYTTLEEGELYNVQTDPDHIRNLWNDPASQEIKLRLICQLLSTEMNKRPPSLSPSVAADDDRE